MAKVRSHNPRTDANVFDSYSILDLVSNCVESRPNHGCNQFDFESVICKNESNGGNFFSNEVWPSLDRDLAALTRSKQSSVNDTSESVSLSALAQTHFLSNHTTDQKAPSEINNTVTSLADYFNAVSTKQEICDFSEEKNHDKQQFSLADLYFEENDEESEAFIMPEVNLNICIKPDIALKSQKNLNGIIHPSQQKEELCDVFDLLSVQTIKSDKFCTELKQCVSEKEKMPEVNLNFCIKPDIALKSQKNLNGIIHPSQQKEELSDVFDLLSVQTIKSDKFFTELKQCVSEKEKKCSFTKNLYPSAKICKLNAKSSSFAKALSYNTETNNLFRRKAAEIEREMNEKVSRLFTDYFDETDSTYSHEELENNTVRSANQSIFKPKNFIRTYGTEKIYK